MQRAQRFRSCLVLLTFTLASIVSSAHSAQANTPIRKQLIDGEWKIDGVTMPATLAKPADLTAQSFPPGSWGRLVYTSYQNRNADIWLLTPISSGTLTTQLTSNYAADSEPRLNPAAVRVVFVSNRDGNDELYRINISDRSTVRLTITPAADTQAAWSPDGRRIVFASLRDGNWNLYVMNADGSGQARLTSDGAPDIMPSWSPDGRTIAWVRAGSNAGAIWLMNADGSNQRAITGPLTYLQHPGWSPDGAQLAFDYDRDGDGFNELATINSDGSGLTAIPYDKTTYGPGTTVDLAMGSWAPPRDWLAVGVAVYNISGGKVALARAFAGGVTLSGSSMGPLTTTNLDTQPDLRSLDLIPPTTSMDAVPLYTRGTTITATWRGFDSGPAQEFVYDVQVRVGNSPWTAWQTGVEQISASYTGVPGSTVSFRIRGRDEAGNSEAWHSPSGGGTTTFFSSRLFGTVRDNRGKPVPAAELQLDPPSIVGNSTNPNGTYSAYLATNTGVSSTPNHAGYQSPPPTTLNMQQDRAFNPYLLPTDNQIQNGSFEASASQPTNWTPGGSLPATVTDQAALTGNRAVLLGQACPFPCLTDPQVSSVPGDPSYDLAAGSDGTTYVVFSQQDISTWPSVSRLMYTTRTPNGTWTTPQPTGFEGGAPRLALDTTGTLHLAWITPNRYVRYSQRSASGTWSTPIELGPAESAQIVADRQGQIYVTVPCYGSTCEQATPGVMSSFYRKRTAAGVWQPPVYIPTSQLTLAVGPDDQAYVVWQQATPNTLYNYSGYLTKIRPDGTLGTTQEFISAEGFNRPQAVVDQNNIVHVVWGYGAHLYYAAVFSDGEATAPLELASSDSVLQLAIDGQATLHLLSGYSSEGLGTYYRSKPLYGAWTDPVMLDSAAYGSQRMTIDQNSRIRILGDGPGSYNGPYVYRETPLVATSGTAAIKQSLTVPTTNPTLAFMYALRGITAGNGSRLDVVVTGNGSSTTVQSITAGAGWTLASVDLRQWAGQTVDVAIVVRQNEGAPPATALIDDVSVGSWQTPVITSVTPGSIPSPSTATEIIIRGENFLSASTVQLGATPLDDVQRIDDQTLRVRVPAGIKPGRYELWVINPGGQAAAYPQFLIGKEVLLPLIWR